MKLAIITGASRGIGKAIAEKLAADGYDLLLNCRVNFSLLRDVAASLREHFQVHVTAVRGEITKDSLYQLLGDPTEAKNRELELLLINNAGISRFTLFQEISRQEYDEMLDSNVGTAFRLSQAVIPYLLHAGDGRILNISSVWGAQGASFESVYSLTKGAVNAMTRALGKELAPNHIPVNALLLGAIDTEMNRHLNIAEKKALEAEIPYGRMASPEEVADFAGLLLKSPKYLTSQLIVFDGGWI